MGAFCFYVDHHRSLLIIVHRDFNASLLPNPGVATVGADNEFGFKQRFIIQFQFGLMCI